MIYTPFGNTGINISKLGFGAMRLPMVDRGGESLVDEEKAVPMMRRAFDLGVNYIDSAPGYCNQLSEKAVGLAVKGYMGKVYVSTKNSVGNASGDEWMGRLESSLKQLDMDSIDFYHFWGIGLGGFETWQKAGQNNEFGPLEAARRAKEQGMIKHLSFSYHDNPENFKPIVDSGVFESVLMQYNLMDRSNEANLAYAREKGLGVVVMGPLGGGRFGPPSEFIRGLLKDKVKSTAEMAMRFVLANENVHVALSGMNTVEMVEENAAIASRTDQLTEDEWTHITDMMDKNRKLAELYCTGCNYCMPCPKEIDIPHLFTLMNQHRLYGMTEVAKHAYRDVVKGWSWKKMADATKCEECGQCESKCPQKIEIIRQLKETHETLKPE